MLGACVLAVIAASTTQPVTAIEPAIQPVLVRTMPLSLAHEVVVEAGRAGLPAHLALELAQSESGER
jgi:hypothetical protein